MREGSGGTLRCTSSVYEAQSEGLTKRVRGCLCVCGREKERETVVMIDARLPPLCSSEWLQQNHRITSLLPALLFFPSLPASQLADEGFAHSSAEAMLRLSRRRKQNLWLPSTS